MLMQCLVLLLFVQCRELTQSNLDAEMCEQIIGNLPNLVELKLNENKLQRMPIFHGLFSLKKLELANNEISEISLNALLVLPRLTHLDLSRNMIDSIASNSFPKENFIQKL